MQTIYLDLFQKAQIPPLHATQRDVGRKFKAVFTNGAEPYPIPADTQLSIWYSGTSGSGHYSGMDGRSAFAVEGNTVTVELIAQMLVNKGKGELNLCMNRPDGTQLGMWIIVYEVEPLPGADSQEAQQHFDAFAEVTARALRAAADAEQAAQTFATDPTLSVSGKAADAAAAGAALAGKAPAGYGLGVHYPKTADNLDSIRNTGWYVKPFPLFGGGLTIIRHEGLGYNNAKQTAFSTVNMGGNNATVVRYMSNNVWTDWEWVNPLMEVGVEYRTTERYNGHPVYTKTVDIGTLPNAGSKVVATSIVATHIVDLCGSAKNDDSYTILLPHKECVVNSSNNGRGLHIITYSDLSTYSGYVIAKYTKD